VPQPPLRLGLWGAPAAAAAAGAGVGSGGVSGHRHCHQAPVVSQTAAGQSVAGVSRPFLY
jgi:hypothetical protein